MTQMMFTKEGCFRREISPEEEITTLKERIAALEKANNLMREGLYAAKAMVQTAKDSEAVLRRILPYKHYEAVESALRASSAVENMITALDAHKEALEWN